MQGMVTTPFAILLELNTIRIILLVLLGRIVAAFTLSACQGDQSTHEFSFIYYSHRLLLHMNCGK